MKYLIFSLIIATATLTALADKNNRRLLLTRNVATAAPSFDYPLDDTATNAYAAWSVGRPLTNAWTSSLALVVRSSDGATNYVTWTGTSDNISALVSWAGGGDVYVTNLFDQTGNARHMLQGNTNLCPRIITNGVAVTKNGKLAMKFGRNNLMGTASLAPSLPISILVGVYNDNRTGLDIIFAGNGTTRTAIKQGSTAVYSIDSGGLAISSSDALTLDQWEAATAVFTSSDDTIQVNGGTITSGAAGNNAPTAFVLGWSTTGADMLVSEAFVWNAAMPDPAGTGPVRTNMTTFYSFP